MLRATTHACQDPHSSVQYLRLFRLNSWRLVYMLQDSDLNGVVDIRYTGGARMLLLIELGRRKSKMRIKVWAALYASLRHCGMLQGQWASKDSRHEASAAGARLISACASRMHPHDGVPQVPVLVSELDLECKLWIKLRLAPLPPHVGTISLAFVGQPTVRVQLAPYNRVRLMRIPILQVPNHAGMRSTPCTGAAHSAGVRASFSVDADSNAVPGPIAHGHTHTCQRSSGAWPCCLLSRIAHGWSPCRRRF